MSALTSSKTRISKIADTRMSKTDTRSKSDIGVSKTAPSRVSKIVNSRMSKTAVTRMSKTTDTGVSKTDTHMSKSDIRVSKTAPSRVSKTADSRMSKTTDTGVSKTDTRMSKTDTHMSKSDIRVSKTTPLRVSKTADSRMSKTAVTRMSKTTDTGMSKTDIRMSKTNTRMSKTTDSRISKSTDTRVWKTPPNTRVSTTPSIRMSKTPARVSEDKSSGTPSTSPSSLSKSSSISHANLIRGMEEDYTKDNASSPIDLECTIQAERIIKILDELIRKVKLVICLPQLIQEKMLNPVLSEENYDELLYIYKHYKLSGVHAHPIIDEVALDDLKAGDLSMRNRINPELGYMVYILNSYWSGLKPAVDKLINEMKDSYLMRKSTRSFIMTMPPQPELEYLLHVEKFRALMKERLETTAEEKLTAELRAKEMESSNAKLFLKVEEYKSLLKTELISFKDATAAKRNTMLKLEEELEKLESSANEKLQKKILDSERQMVLQSRSHAVRYEILQDDVQQSRENYEKYLRTHLEDERRQRARRYKLETQLLSWLQKYDLKMGEKQAELYQMTQDYEEEMRLAESLEEQLVEQDKEFIPLMAEREEEYHQELAKKELQFQIDHAARVIQTAWRTVLANRAEKKKLRKQLKIMQEKKEIAEQKAALAAKKAEIAAIKAAAAQKKAKRRK